MALKHWLAMQEYRQMLDLHNPLYVLHWVLSLTEEDIEQDLMNMSIGAFEDEKYWLLYAGHGRRFCSLLPDGSFSEWFLAKRNCAIALHCICRSNYQRISDLQSWICILEKGWYIKWVAIVGENLSKLPFIMMMKDYFAFNLLPNKYLGLTTLHGLRNLMGASKRERLSATKRTAVFP